MNPNHILFATDFSDRDLKAFQASCCLALDWAAKLTVLYVLDPREVVKPFDKQVDPKKEFKRFTPNDYGIGFDHIVREGDAPDEILNFAKSNNVSLIALGTHGRKGLDRLVNGSVAEKVIRNAECPVMTLGETVSADPNCKKTRILVPIDFSVYGYAAIDFASRMANATSSELTICYVDASTLQFPKGPPECSEQTRETMDQLRQYTPTISQIKHSHQLLCGDPAKAICEYANSNSFDYVVLGTHGRSGVSRALMGSVAEHVVRNANVPVIAVKPSGVRTKITLAGRRRI